MRLDHIVFAAGPGGLAGTSQRLSELLGESFADGGVHPRFGTRNAILPLTGATYFEIVEVLDHPASDKAPFGQPFGAGSELGGGGLGWSSRSTTSLPTRHASAARPSTATGTARTDSNCS